jgi:hypothetical protein
MVFQVDAHAASLRNPDAFWLPLADRLVTWIKKPTKALALESSSSPPKWVWFPDGTLNTCYNAVDRHPPSRVAIEYVSPVADRRERITYGQLRERVERVAGMLKGELRVEKGDTVIIYSTGGDFGRLIGSADDSGGGVCDVGVCEDWGDSFGCVWGICGC